MYGCHPRVESHQHIYMLLTEAPIERDCSCRNRGSMTSKNSAGDKMDPCCTPRPSGKGEERLLPQANRALTISVPASYDVPCFGVNSDIEESSQKNGELN